MTEKYFVGWEQRALRAGAAAFVSPFNPDNLVDPDFNRAWAGDGLGAQYIDFATGGTVFGSRVTAAAVSSDLRAVDFHPTHGWVLLAVAGQLEVRAWDRVTGAVAAVATDTQAKPNANNPWLAAKFSRGGRFILATNEADSGADTIRLRHFDPVTGSIGGAISVPSAEIESPPTGARGLVWAHNDLGFAMVGGDDLNVWSFNPTTGVATFVQFRDVGASSAHCLDWHPSVTTTSYIVVGHANSPHLGKFDVTLTAGVPTAVSTVTAIGVSPGTVVCCAFSPTGDRLALCTTAPAVVMVPFTTTFGSPWSAPATQVAAERRAVAWARSGDYVAFGGGGVDDPDLYPVGAASWGVKVTAHWDLPDAYQNAIALDPSGAWFASVSSAGVLEITEFEEAPSDAQEIALIAIKGVNLTRSAQGRLRGDAQRDMASGGASDTGFFDLFDQANISQERFDQIAAAFGTNVYIVLAVPATKRFWRLDLSDPDNPDGQFMAQFLLATVSLDRERNWGEGAIFDVDHPGTSKTKTDGGADIIRRRPPQRYCRLPIGEVDATTARSSYFPLAIEGPSRLIVVLPDPSDRAWCHLQGFIGTLDDALGTAWTGRMINSLRINASEAR